MTHFASQVRLCLAAVLAAFSGIALGLPLLSTAHLRRFEDFTLWTPWAILTDTLVGACVAVTLVYLRTAAVEQSKARTLVLAALLGAGLLVAADCASDAIGIALAKTDERELDVVFRTFFVAVAFAVPPFALRSGDTRRLLRFAVTVVFTWLATIVLYQITSVLFIGVASILLDASQHPESAKVSGFLFVEFCHALYAGCTAVFLISTDRLRGKPWLRASDGWWTGKEIPLENGLRLAREGAIVEYVDVVEVNGRFRAESTNIGSATINDQSFSSHALKSGDRIRIGDMVAVYVEPLSWPRIS